MRERGVELPIEKEYTESDSENVFYNTEMITNRDLSEAAVAYHASKREDKLEGIDVFGATGIRGLRFAKHLDQVVINDSSSKAVETIREAKEDNQVTNVEVTNRYANQVLSENWNGFDVLDVDPYGSFAEYLDSAARASRDRALAGFTATDNGVVGGTYPKVCRRKYGRYSRRFPFKHEIGARIYVSAIIEGYARQDKAFEPVMTFHERHYTRVIGRVHNSKKSSNRHLSEFSDFFYCRNCGERGFDHPDDCPACGSGKLERLSNIYAGKIQNPNFLEGVAQHVEDEWDEAGKIVNSLVDEAEILVPYFDIHEMASVAGVSAPRTDELVERIREKGYPVSESHFSDVGMKTTAPAGDVVEVIKDLS